MRISFIVPGTPQSLKRHRHVNMGKFVKVYDPSAEEKENFLIKAMLINKPESPILGPIELTLTFYMPRPKGHYGTGRNEGKLKTTAPKYHTKKPDLDNMVKFIKDALNGIYWKDDSQVFSLNHTKKVYTELTPRVEIVIEEIN